MPRYDLETRLQGSPVIDIGNDSASIDTRTLCEAKHSVWIYATDEDGSGIPNAVDDSIIVGFSGLDSSGAGCLDQFVEGVITFITDPEEWRDVVTDGLIIMQQNLENCDGFGNCLGATAGFYVYATGYGVTNALAYTGQAVGSAYTYTTQGLGGALADVYSPTYGEGAGGGFAKWYKEGVDDACYITNAVMESEGRINSPELNSMRTLRDRYGIWFAADEVSQYYQRAPAIVSNINKNPRSRQMYRTLHSEYILPAHRAVQTNNYGEAHQIYKSLVKHAEAFAQESGDAGYSTTGEGSCMDDMGGMVLHNQSGGSHKIKITITRTYEGVTSTEYRSELAGTSSMSPSHDGETIYFEPHYKKFKLTGPGLWTIRCESLAAFMDCGTPDLDYTATVEVAEAPQTDADGNPITAQTSDLSPIIDLAGGSMRPIYTIAALIGMGTVAMYFGFSWLLGKRKKKKKSSDEGG